MAKIFTRPGPNCLLPCFKIAPPMELKFEDQLCRNIEKTPFRSRRRGKSIQEAFHKAQTALRMALLHSACLQLSAFLPCSLLSAPFSRLLLTPSLCSFAFRYRLFSDKACVYRPTSKTPSITSVDYTSSPRLSTAL